MSAHAQIEIRDAIVARLQAGAPSFGGRVDFGGKITWNPSEFPVLTLAMRATPVGINGNENTGGPRRQVCSTAFEIGILALINRDEDADRHIC